MNFLYTVGKRNLNTSTLIVIKFSRILQLKLDNYLLKFTGSNKKNITDKL